MKKKRIIGVIAGAGILILALVFMLALGGGRTHDGSERRYALNLYDEAVHYTRGIEAFYDDNGELIRVEIYIIYDDNSLGFSDSGGESDKYPEAASTCSLKDDGSVRISNFLTAKSIEAGALEDKAFFMANSIYDKIKTEADFKAFLEDQARLAGENGTPSGGVNYIMINGKNVQW